MNITSLGEISRGGFGIVDKVKDETGAVYARKTFYNNNLHPSMVDNVIKRFAKEVRTQEAITHRNIVPILKHDISVIQPYYLMPLAISSLAVDICNDRSLSGRFVTALSDIVAGLETLHIMQIYHRDLKPQNVLRFAGHSGSEDYYAIGDFGLISLHESQFSALTSTGMARGSDYYTAPEITQDLSLASISSDVYSLGCILHDMVGTSTRVPCNEIREDGPFSAILLNCTRNNPKKRFKTVRNVLDAILSISIDSYIPSNEQSIEFISLFESDTPFTKGSLEQLLDFLSNDVNAQDRTAIYMKIGAEHIIEICSSYGAIADRLAVNYASWIQESSFNFDYCDGLANRLEIFIKNCNFEAKSACLIALLEMGTSHNRWYVEYKFMKLCGPNMDNSLASRLGVEFFVISESICRMISHLERSISIKRTQLHENLVAQLKTICK